MGAAFDTYLRRWGLIPDGDAIVTHSSRLLPVRRVADGAPAMLKIAVEPEETFGGGLMVWWDGDGAARVLAHDSDALLLERAGGVRSLAQMARSGADGDTAATRILCQTVARLHRPRPKPLPALVPLTEWFRDLEPAAQTHGGILRVCADTARRLLATPQAPEVVVLHGDIHHGNVLDFGEGPDDWRAIDPKRLHGDRAFDYANLFCNPDPVTATAPGRLQRQVAVVCAESGLAPGRLLEWILAWAGLSAAWSRDDRTAPPFALTVAETAARALGR